MEGNRSGLWHHVVRAIDALDPCLVVIENVRGILTSPAATAGDLELCPWCVGDPADQPAVRALGAVLGSLADLGRDARWCVLRASDVGAPHRRERLFLTAWRRDAAAEDSHQQHRLERRQPAPLQTQGGRPRPEPRGRDRVAAADSEGIRRNQGLTTPAPRQRRPDTSLGSRSTEQPGHHRPRSGDAPSHPVRRLDADQEGPREWGRYGDAIARWERLTRPAPAPTDDAGRLSPRFVEWMQGLDDGWVTATPGLGRPAQLTALGNGVVPHQAIQALRTLAPPTATCRHCSGG
ncbi:DNA cytosine methyltransferase [Streptomyces iranensis]|uniref:DNA cytosine methyltransferase n=1 Tax=Streptomyces iranensis TaxID=576784 RepID=UPI002479EE8A|nr:DNA cytosine methyltransferase [Streptomyces iranensis]